MKSYTRGRTADRLAISANPAHRRADADRSPTHPALEAGVRATAHLMPNTAHIAPA
ncbi:hypothetical protein OTB20_25060 [Streptomyces sp. H27-H1]|uniref:hypothetical protein n=1 Tax=Streptomyces sp. H27-H1 TaxID=2996461 RepID=UPI0022700418|nr:hypothetical protein [Streptomyces sp. H27-H1]MCY0929409.1 hypothetical protein [Streptomyces sp. H27-H1]